ncbi:G-protein coupled receptor GRL101-like [Strongylocentrotus purpuratus]|uniref:G-protein coupled receptors family 1 profile domain-containing protein n=1 Tax=Strongylocentrotus purpuratus TaxID=7668 RepID=A0A7M7PDG9_STRPU|nr:G-protein coupled receptor GRL101-like [Strongylocentrotus purpuratus]
MNPSVVTYSTSGDACDLATDITCSNGACASHTTRCLHELDEYGFFTGCRDVTHLRACGNFECPESYLKCPSSYCIPLRYRCDGKMDCPSGEDEAFCGQCPQGCECDALSYSCRPDQVDLRLLPRQLRKLNLARNSIRSLFRSTFDGLHRMKTLNLSGNPLTVVEAGAFGNLTLLQELDLRGTAITVTTDTGRDVFHGLGNLRKIHADRYVFCCLAGLVDSVGCNAPRDQFSSCEELMANGVLRIFIWILGGSAFIGNGFVFAYRVFNQKKDRKTIVQSSFITNLAVSDFMMGLYMITIASADIYYRGNYALHADEWQSSALCKVAGMLSVISSEASVMFIMMISVDRCIHILLPFKQGLHLSPTAARCSQLIIWCIGTLVSVLPVVIPAYSKGNFYGQSGVCLALPLTVDRPAGWHYSISLFIGANFVAFLVTLLCYLAMYIRYQQSKQMLAQTGKGSRDDKRLTEDIKLAWKMSLIVGTDLICWFPIIVMGLLSAAGELTISAQVYAWTAVFVLPVNSSLNPYLYTLSSLHGKKQKVKKSAESATEENKTMESSFGDGDGCSTAEATNRPVLVAQHLEHWLKSVSRDLTRQELEVIRRDINQSHALLRNAGNTVDGCLKNM